MTIGQWLKMARGRVTALEADLILMEVLRERERSWLVLNEGRELTEGEQADAEKKLRRRESGEPLAYILGRKEFYGRDFKVSPAVLIPRGESEELVEMALAAEEVRQLAQCSGAADGAGQKRADGVRLRRVIEVGTGSGCLAITIALERPDWTVRAGEISPAALAVAQENAESWGVKAIDFRQSDLLNELETDDLVAGDLIIANLPYVDPEWSWLGAELRFEPEGALYAEEGGLALIKRLIGQVRTLDVAGLELLLEADPVQHAAIIEYGRQKGLELVKRGEFAVLLRVC